MRKLMRYLVLLIVLASAAGIIYGFTLMEEAPVTANKLIGFGVVGLFLLAMPLFLVSESRGKNLKDYMLTDQKIREMRENRKKTTENQ
ncbi:hypothetical protein [Robiginitalea sp. SC105]|uniref:hypothetical protein n=1 Tax=Robiginitalea sp. SC105 TaxID=2762332 RepID=UPI001639B110|nr:hypothetical protein [Robiginitalea sp. SC105]MBC2838419.1 hypothetical protein [Robiginitalea sp. SC105]